MIILFPILVTTDMTVNDKCDFKDYITISEAYIKDEEEPSAIFCGSKFPEAVYSE